MPELNALQRWWLNAWPHRMHLRRHVPAFLRAAPEPFRGEVLEIGAGRGWTSRRILDTFPQVELTATDIDPKAAGRFDEMSETYGRRLHMREADVRELPFDRDTFDIVVAINVMQYLDKEDIPRAIHELLRVTQPGGMIGISDAIILLAPFRSVHPVVENVLREEGCEILHMEGGRHYDIWAQKPYPKGQGGE